LGREPDLLVVNQLYPAVEPSGGSEPPPGTALFLWHQRRAINEQQLARLAREWSGPRVELPLLPVERGPKLARQLADLLVSDAGWSAP